MNGKMPPFRFVIRIFHREEVEWEMGYTNYCLGFYEGMIHGFRVFIFTLGWVIHSI